MKPVIEVFLPYYHPDWMNIEGLQGYDISDLITDDRFLIGISDKHEVDIIKKKCNIDYDPNTIGYFGGKLFLPLYSRGVDKKHGELSFYDSVTTVNLKGNGSLVRINYTHLSDKYKTYISEPGFNPDKMRVGKDIIIIPISQSMRALKSSSRKINNGYFVIFGDKKGPALKVSYN